MTGSDGGAQNWLRRGLDLHGAGNLVAAAAQYRIALALDPAQPDGLNLLGLTCVDRADAIPAGRWISRAVAVLPIFAAFHANLGRALLGAGAIDAARPAFNRTVALEPTSADAADGLAGASWLGGARGAARDWAARAAVLSPLDARLWRNLSAACEAAGAPTSGRAAAARALALAPGDGEAWGNLANLAKFVGAQDQALSLYDRALRCLPGHRALHSNLVFLHQELATPDALDVARTWAARHLEAAPPRRRFPPAGSRLRIGYVSPDFRAHSCAWFLEPLLRAHDRSRVEVFAYAEVARPDWMTERLRRHCDHWRATTGLSDPALAEVMMRDRLDVVVDLAGHTGGNRLAALACRPAPVQVNWLGYNATTGVAAIDYKICDVHLAPPGMEAQFTEKLWRLDGFAHCFGPPERSPDPSPLPAGSAGSAGIVTFGSFNNLSKLTTATVALWAALMREVPRSRLLLKARLGGEAEVGRVIARRFAASGIAPERIIVGGWSPDYAGHLGSYGQVDLALDTFPYNGTTTTCEALWMGVPVVTLAGPTMMGRVGASLLVSAGLEDCVATSAADFVARAAGLAQDFQRLADRRAGLRAQILARPLTDARTFARDMEAAFAAMRADA